ncbi:cytochrome P450 family protein [Streptomyces sp. H27-D2]|uniref:cytochrome P450 family protein n=1 Tax=Streptomyces sp. H27-D2 TaxID=3046304 RepID=UPI002DB8CACD|nr:cytochrome P450 [Streptomyces sp. H27-D2]MEC4018170.1 cytochrome P450 [Streptomyces sp. H27-D2]
MTDRTTSQSQQIVDLTPYGAEFTADPYPWYEKLRAQGPVHRVRTPDAGELWLVVGHEASRSALTDDRLSKDWQFANITDTTSGAAINANMLEADPPEHTRLRRLVAKEFTSRRVEALRPRVREIAEELLDAMSAGSATGGGVAADSGGAAAGLVPGARTPGARTFGSRAPEARRADLVDAFCFPLPMTVICELLGVPSLDREAFRGWSNEIVARTSPEAEAEAVREMGAYLVELIEDKRCSPGEDLISALIRTMDEDGDRLSSDELVGMAFLLLVAGHETTVNLISNTVRALLQHPEQLAALRADMSLVDGAVEETLRYDGPVETSTYRFAREPVEIGGTTIPAGEAVLVALASAGRDPNRFPDPDRFDIRRPAQGHVAFGHGLHFCLGAPLARMEARIAVRALLERCPELALDLDPAELEWVPGMLMRGVRRLPIRW